MNELMKQLTPEEKEQYDEIGRACQEGPSGAAVTYANMYGAFFARVRQRIEDDKKLVSEAIADSMKSRKRNRRLIDLN